MLDVADYVSIVARTPAGRILVVRQYRPVVDRETIELPSGHIDSGELPEDAACRELLEETGMVAKKMVPLGVLVPDVGRLTNRMWCYFATDVTPAAGEIDREDGVDVIELSEQEVLAMATDGRMDHALNLAALFLAVTKKRLVLV